MGHLGLDITEETIREAFRAAECRADFSKFYSRILRDRQGEPLELTPLLHLINDTVDSSWAAGKHVSLVAAPGMGKSTYARGKALHLLGNHPNRNYAFISAANSTAKDNVSFCRAILAQDAGPDGMNSYRAIFPEIIPDFEEDQLASRGWRQGEFFIQRTGQASDPVFGAFPVRTTSEARRIDVAIFDDAMTRQIANSPQRRKEVIDAVKNTWMEGRLVDGDKHGHALFIQNCWNTSDLAHLFRFGDPEAAMPGGREDVTSLWIAVNDTNTAFSVSLVHPSPAHPIIQEDEYFGARQIDETTWEFPFPAYDNLYNKGSLDRMEAADPTTFNRAYRLRALSDDDLLFPHWKMRTRINRTVADLIDMPLDPLGRVYVPRDRRREIIISAGFDISSTKRKGNWLCISARLPDNRRVVIELHRGNWAPYGVVKLLAECYHRLPWEILYVENNGVQDQLVEAYRGIPESGKFRHTIQPFTTGSNKMSEEVGLPQLDLMLSNSTYVWCDPEFEQGGYTYQAHLEFASAMATTERHLQKGKTPDSIMAWWFADRGLTYIAPKPEDFVSIKAEETDRILGGYSDGDMDNVLAGYN